MVNKESLHLGQRVLYGDDRREAVVDGLTKTVVGLVLLGEEGRYVICEYSELYLEGVE